jgi:hypothetical protein
MLILETSFLQTMRFPYRSKVSKEWVEKAGCDFFEERLKLFWGSQIYPTTLSLVGRDRGRDCLR